MVVVLGHIDHGKTSLLNAIRNLQFTEQKPGGVITQHVGAYQVEVPLKEEPKSRESEANRGILRSAQDDSATRKITFLDTPGHEAFSQIRSRGAKVADIALLVIDAAEGVREQTKEAISHIKKSNLSFIVVFNKIDKPNADPEKVKRELMKEEITVESMGGQVPTAEVSAKTGQGIPELLDLILLVAEMQELKADFEKPGQGVVIESYQDSFRGPTATLLLTDGCLKTGDIIGTDSAWTKIKDLENFLRVSVEKAWPGDPIIVFGFNQVPKVGEEFKVFLDAESAEKNIKIVEPVPLATPSVAAGEKILNLIIKADVEGSLEAIEGILKNLPQDKVILRILKAAVGNIGESDLKTAEGTKALVVGFRVKIDATAKKMAERKKISLIVFELIYELVEGVRKIMEKALESEEIRQDLGKMKVLAVFLSEKNRQILGGRVVEGEIRKGASVEVFRNEEKIGQGRMINLQRSKKDADKVVRGEECGLLLESDIKVIDGDTLVFYTKERRKLEL